ncbi:uncharacterized protein LOC117565472 [Drosophila albomicans]|uniref:Uncharacterized protein LOC117565472 n=1 Tax=Drosophila albomicans TaxID=7291 RepID=A0A6P8WQP2_DROAB|nr:uncharacterized protein LOC117565472 [Drosophila albomicans]
MVQLRTLFWVVTFVGILYDETQGKVQIYNRNGGGGEPRNISVNIHGANAGNICIDCQNQIQVDAGLDGDDDVGISDLQQYLGESKSQFPPFFYLPSQEKQNPIVLSSPSDSISAAPINSASVLPITFLSDPQMDSPLFPDLENVDDESLSDVSPGIHPLLFDFPEALESDDIDTPESSV